MNRKKTTAIFLAVLMLFGIFLSYFFIIENAHHKCSGEGCSICFQVEDAIHFISAIKVVPMLSLLMAVLFVLTKWVAVESDYSCVKNTLITLKVELLN